jgi:FG-GAP-like repeat
MLTRGFPHSLSVVMFLFTGLAASAQVKFTSAYYDSGDSATQSIVNGDFNNDGILDLVSVNAESLSFYKGLGGGKFASAVAESFPAYAGQAAAADFNGDGKLDLAVVCGNCSELGNQILIYFGNGNGTFTAGPGLVTSNVPLAIALGDFNGDHIPDIAVSECSSPASACSMEVFLGQGKGTFKRSAALSYGGGQVVAGDFNADGHQDLAVLAGPSPSELAMFLGNGNGTFKSPKLASFAYTGSLTVGDFYNDRIQSLAILFQSGDSNNYVTTARYSSGELQVGTSQLIDVSGNYSYITSGDLNGDFLDDIAIVGSGSAVPNPAAAYMLGEGNGSFQSTVNISATGQSEIASFIRDLNLDSRHDLGAAWTDSDSRYGTGGGVFAMLDTNATTNCTPPPANKLSVHICAPSSGQTVGSSFTFKAAGNAFNGVAKRMELWIDNKKIGQDLEDQLKITTTLTKGKHTASFVVVDTFDSYTSSSVTFNSN